HHYEEPAIDVFPMVTYPEGCGLGRVGRLAKPATIQVLVSRIKKALGVRSVNLAARPSPDSQGPRRTGGGRGALVTRVACAAGPGGSLFRLAAASGATFYLTGEMAHHDVLAAVHLGMTVLCAGHSHTERVALKHMLEKLRLTAPALPVALAQRDNDPFEVV
ncbi:MAG: Nif3-like dinuclear metal center hexameric protein, partial [Planctomycetota bacterium]|nr:Nif3-like dinuclear metal center hexameric protein [Planctomycetota bacterium]